MLGFFKRRAEEKRRQETAAQEAKLKEEAAFKFGQDVSVTAAAAIDDYLGHRVPQVSEILLGTLRTQIAKHMHIIPGRTPRDVAKAELQTFFEEHDRFLSRMTSEVHETQKASLTAVVDLAGQQGRALIDELIKTELEKMWTDLMHGGIAVAADTIRASEGVQGTAKLSGPGEQNRWRSQ